jgi:hypothetical protein
MALGSPAHLDDRMGRLMYTSTAYLATQQRLRYKYEVAVLSFSGQSSHENQVFRFQLHFHHRFPANLIIPFSSRCRSRTSLPRSRSLLLSSRQPSPRTPRSPTGTMTAPTTYVIFGDEVGGMPQRHGLTLSVYIRLIVSAEGAQHKTYQVPPLYVDHFTDFVTHI